ncbi:GDP-mannose 4,6-dehydratase [Clostridium beijerinckii]|uniref:GDP-mannose 4,6-dehydratase n=1 Tax=Clostridium beijerinckii TaxID=1520 RepID=A0AAW3W312_CLOBE|nr:GDP-mannose 4,6-dehydratase [Clostridium beijerinckii]MBC2455741.1 GDP-mannose 4,6-dehydratase [Clostridium beijerinckii]MBC2473218.1 GDP-mannose 4,6-dehydratase [Clostridium beijerinckii]NOV62273.1 GDP-4-dehydro-6-deoxy-D-mannose reductase [Clostridium beijerinckii]NOV68230.1 GDP-4-dehydro-6-deoxy-D-mannose reductase [Clostridium beijerinckii]NOW30325.1 GDP-4-dehydro-6-deoxy-D-mannose reductase [Clostridium beijerinckii]
MKALITGINGFVGKYLSKCLLEQGNIVYGTVIEDNVEMENINITQMNLLDKEEVVKAIKTINPDYVYHLAGQSAVGLSWKEPVLTMNVNINGTINLLDAVRENNLNTKVLVIGSSDEYGVIKPEECPISEKHLLNPSSPYAISKMTQEQIAKLYINSYKMNIIMVRAFNHIGPMQNKNFVVSDFASKIAEIEKGAEAVIRVGNLESFRDFTDVRDIVRGYTMLMENGKIGEVYNIGSGKAHKIQDILDILLSLSTTKIKVEIDPERLRPSDVPIIQCDNSKIKAHVNWIPEYDIKNTLKDTLDYWRNM